MEGKEALKGASSVSMEVLYAEILKLTPKLDAIEGKVQELSSDVKAIQEATGRQDKRIEEAEQRISNLEDGIENVPAMRAQIKELEEALTEQENRARRNNIRIFGVPESVGTQDIGAFLTNWLPKVLEIQFSPPLDIQRAHRVPSRITRSENRTPRPIVAYLLRFTQVQEILNKAKALKRITYTGHNIFIAPDYARETAKLRKQFLDFRPTLKKLDIRYGLLHPAKMLLTHNNKKLEFTDPAELHRYLQQGVQSPMEGVLDLPATAQLQQKRTGPRRELWASQLQKYQFQSSSPPRERRHTRPGRGEGGERGELEAPARREESRSPLKESRRGSS